LPEATMMEDRYEDVTTPTSALAPMGSGACPKCSFPVSGGAVECPACGIVYAKFRGVAPREARPPRVWREGSFLVLRRGARLPNRCVRCNRPATERLHKSLWWFHEAVVWVAWLKLLLAFLLALVLLRTATVTVPLCSFHYQSRKAALWTGWLLVAGGVVVTIVCALVDLAVDEMYWIIVGPLMAMVGALPLVFGIQIVVPKKIDRDHVWLEKVCREYLDLLPESPHQQ
jgi:hypothetical protein